MIRDITDLPWYTAAYPERDPRFPYRMCECGRSYIYNDYDSKCEYCLEKEMYDDEQEDRYIDE